jgi:hypothetical protein
MKKMVINDINNETVCDYIQKSFITSSYIVGLGSIDGQTPFSLLNEIYATKVYTQDELEV